MGLGSLGGIPVPTTVVAPRPLPSGPVSSAIVVAEALRDACLGCETADLLTANLPKDFRRNLGYRDSVSCSYDDDEISIHTWNDHSELERAMPSFKEGACFVARNHETNQTYVAGTNWIAWPQRESTVRLMATRLATPTATVTC